MFVLCPNCQFLVAVDPASGLPPTHCPRCRGVLIADVEPPEIQAATPAELADRTDAASAGPMVPTIAAVEHEERITAEATAAAEPAAIEAADAEALGDEAKPDAAAAAAPMVEAEPLVDEATAEGAAAPTGTVPVARTDAGAVDAPEPAAAPPASPQPAPSFARPAHGPAPGATAARRWPHAGAIAALALLLVAQILLADRDRLSADAQWRPALQAFCAALRCDLAPWREPSAITLLDRNVVPDPSHPGVLHVTASFRNDARWPQPWPRLVLTLSDVDGRVAGARAFEPAEYLGHAVTKNAIATGQTASIAMDIVEPAPRIVAFTFDFR